MGGPIGQFIVYDATPSNKINWKKFFTKVVNVGKTVIKAAASVINANPAITVSYAALIKNMANIVTINTFTTGSVEQNILQSYFSTQPVDVTSPVHQATSIYKPDFA